MNNQDSTKEVATIKEQMRLMGWRREIEECQSSGLSVSAWCVQNGLSPSTYYYRSRRLRGATCQQLHPEEPLNENAVGQPAIVPIRKAGNVCLANVDTTLVSTAFGGIVPGTTAHFIEIETEHLHVKLPTDSPVELICAMLRELKP